MPKSMAERASMLLRYGVAILILDCLTTYALIRDFDDVVELTMKDFDRTINAQETFVMFHAPWCGHCKNLKPTWTELARHYETKTLNIAKVDCTSETSLCADHGVKGYPTLKLYSDKSKDGVRFKSQRTLENFHKFIKEHGSSGSANKKPVYTTADMKYEEDVIVLNSENYQDLLAYGDWFVMFYAPWCGHCKNLKPEWSRLALGQNFKDNNHVISVAKMDCTESTKACSEFDIKGYPSLLYIRNGLVIDKHNGERDLESLTKFVDDHPFEDDGGANERIQLQDDGEEPREAVAVLTEETFTETIEDDGLTFVKFYAPWCGHCKRLAPVWEELGQSFIHDDTVIITKIDCTEAADICSKQEVAGYPTLKLYKSGKLVAQYSGDRDVTKLKAFVNQHKPKDEL